MSKKAKRQCDNCQKKKLKCNGEKLCRQCRSTKMKCVYTKDSSDEDDHFEVESIVADKIENGKKLYLVKWIGWASADNTWLSKSNLNCPVLLQNYENRKAKKIQMKGKDMAAPEPELNPLQGRPVFTDDYIVPAPKRIIADGTPHKEKWLKLLERSRLNFKITNTVDDDPPPDLIWVDECVPDTDVPNLNLEKTAGCDCGDTDCQEGVVNCQCLEARGGVSPYDKHGCVRFAPIAMAIYECNLKCACSIYCPNRVTQRIPNNTFDIYKTENGRGWGVKTVEPLRKGRFISRYVGQIITDEEANQKTVFNYMFDIDFFANDGCKYVIDASKIGNISRFFNHSCEPNMATYSVFIDTDDSYRHELAFFTTRAIQADEELTFDYGGFKGGHGGSDVQSFEACVCGSSKCRGRLPLAI